LTIIKIFISLIFIALNKKANFTFSKLLAAENMKVKCYSQELEDKND